MRSVTHLYISIAMILATSGCFRVELMWESYEKIEIRTQSLLSPRNLIAGDSISESVEVSAPAGSSPGSAVRAYLYKDGSCTQPALSGASVGQSAWVGLDAVFSPSAIRITKSGTVYLRFESAGLSPSVCAGPITVTAQSPTQWLAIPNEPRSVTPGGTVTVRAMATDLYGNPSPLGTTPPSAKFVRENGAAIFPETEITSVSPTFDVTLGTHVVTATLDADIATPSGIARVKVGHDSGSPLMNSTLVLVSVDPLSMTGFELTGLPAVIYKGVPYTLFVRAVDDSFNTIDTYTGSPVVSVGGTPVGAISFGAGDRGFKEFRLTVPPTATGVLSVSDGTHAEYYSSATIIDPKQNCGTPTAWAGVNQIWSDDDNWSPAVDFGIDGLSYSDVSISGGTHPQVSSGGASVQCLKVNGALENLGSFGNILRIVSGGKWFELTSLGGMIGNLFQIASDSAIVAKIDRDVSLAQISSAANTESAIFGSKSLQLVGNQNPGASLGLSISSVVFINGDLLIEDGSHIRVNSGGYLHVSGNIELQTGGKLSVYSGGALTIGSGSRIQINGGSFALQGTPASPAQLGVVNQGDRFNIEVTDDESNVWLNYFVIGGLSSEGMDLSQISPVTGFALIANGYFTNYTMTSGRLLSLPAKISGNALYNLGFAGGAPDASFVLIDASQVLPSLPIVTLGMRGVPCFDVRDYLDSPEKLIWLDERPACAISTSGAPTVLEVM